MTLFLVKRLRLLEGPGVDHGLDLLRTLSEQEATEDHHHPLSPAILHLQPALGSFPAPGLFLFSINLPTCQVRSSRGGLPVGLLNREKLLNMYVHVVTRTEGQRDQDSGTNVRKAS